MTITHQADFDLERFVAAQKTTFDRALDEIRQGKKRTHWMWFIFPQFVGLGFSSTAEYYAIKSTGEAKAYLDHSILGPRLLACVDALLSLNGRTVEDIFGYPDYLKLRSCATLFAQISDARSPFEELLRKYYPEGLDPKTLELLGSGDRQPS